MTETTKKGDDPLEKAGRFHASRLEVEVSHSEPKPKI